jgi:predicted TIM-barrel fold metal-dependent hydrolase
MTKPRLVDVHSHIYPRSYVDLLAARPEIPRVAEHQGNEYFVIFEEEQSAGPGGGRPFDRTYWDLNEKLKFMDANGIDQTVVSLGNPWLDPFDGPESVDLARGLNEELASYQVATDGRVIGMGVLPANDIESAARVAEEVADAPGLRGIVIGQKIAGHRLDDAALEPLWETLAERGIPVLIHPHYSAAAEQLKGFGHALPVAVGFPFETTIAVARFVLAGTLNRHPNLKVIASHGGGTLPYLAGRLDSAWRSDPSVQDRLPYPPSRDLAKLLLDSILFHERSLHAAADLVGLDHMLYGTDHPFSIADPATNLAALIAAFPEAEVTQVGSATAAAVFNLGVT